MIISTDRAKRPTDFVRESVKIKGKGFCPFCYGNESKTPPEILAYGRNGGAAQHARLERSRRAQQVPRSGHRRRPRPRGRGHVRSHERRRRARSHHRNARPSEHARDACRSAPSRKCFWAYRDRVLDLKNDKRFRYVLIFKNHGEAAGASLEHSHSQLIALPIVPKRVLEEIEGARHYYREKERCIFCDVIHQETETGVRVIGENDLFITLAPYAPRFPFEMWLLPKQHGSSFENNQSPVYASLARALKDNLMRMDAVLDHPAYNFMLHTSPIGEESNEHYHWHFEIMPKLTKVAGFEWGTGFYICPTPPEESARFLREADVTVAA